MAGSKGGQHSKGNGKSKSNRSDMTKGNEGAVDMKEKNPHPALSYASGTSRSRYTEREVEELLFIKLEGLYAKAKDWLLRSGYSTNEVETALLNIGHIHGKPDLLNNILTNSIAFIEKRIDLPRKSFEDMGELYKTFVETMVNTIMQAQPEIHRSDALWHLLVNNWGRVPSTTRTSDTPSGDQNMHGISSHQSYGSCSRRKDDVAGALGQYSGETIPSEPNDSSSMKKTSIMEGMNIGRALESYLTWNVLIITADIKKTIGVPVNMHQAIPRSSSTIAEDSDIVPCLKEFLESSSDEQKTAMILDLVKSIKDLQEKAKEHKDWAQKKAIDSARRLSKDLQELKMLQMEAVDKKRLKNELIYAKKSCMVELLQMDHSLQRVNFQRSAIVDSVRSLEANNAQIRAVTEALNIHGSESERELKEVLKRERKCLRKASDVEKQIHNLQSQCEAENQRVLLLEAELLQAEKEIEEAEVRWRQEIKEKENMSALLAEETRTAETRKANSRAELLKLRQKVEIDSQVERDDYQRLEDELSRLRISQQMPNSLLDDANFWSHDAEASSSSESMAPIESSEKSFRHWICMICLQNEVSVVLLPCTHQVLCFSCFETNCREAGHRCPYCHAAIEDSITVFGPSS